MIWFSQGHRIGSFQRRERSRLLAKPSTEPVLGQAAGEGRRTASSAHARGGKDIQLTSQYGRTLTISSASSV